ncbi:MAG: PAS and ANTAR domain-containing protein [Nocardioidaceae bacterium]
MTTTNTGPIGSFSYTHASDSWTWSEALYEIHGFAPREVVPSTELLLVHKHPADRPAAEALIRTVRETGERFSFFHRIVDAQGALRHVHCLGEGVRDAAGRLTGLRGYMADLTGPVRRITAVEVEEAVSALEQTRPAIEQVKGALMLTFGIDPDGAFEVLRRYSQMTNVKVRDLARTLADGIASGALPAGVFPAGDRASWLTLVDELRTRRAGGGPVEQS